MTTLFSNRCRVKRIKKAPGFLFGLALLLQLLMPFTHAFAGAIAGDGGDTVVICTPAGFVSVTLAADGSLAEHPTLPVQPAPCEFCQVCQTSGLGATAFLGSEPVEFAPTQIARSLENIWLKPAGSRQDISQPPSRAPPAGSVQDA